MKTGGPIPKPKPARARDEARRTIETTTLEAPDRDVPKLPPKMTAGTKAWWESWKRSPQAELFGPTDWTRLRMLALIVDAYFRDPTPARMAEIRQNESRFGATPEDRLRLRWRFRDVGDPPEDHVGEYGTHAKPARKRRRKDPRLSIVA